LLLRLLLPLVIMTMLSVQSSDVPGRIDMALWSAGFTLVLCATRFMQLGATVSSPIASVDVHFRKSSTAAGCKNVENEEMFCW
jgi:hypothetical protein